ncbi:hypothetical protein AVEN_132380-1 [Araneus ventricosus]|uniref:Tc1-like transposase DDE domain-containing protein n=1 Tax=Araneus ventricosus TaxID=182803 RepID=A0A4Y2DEU4_ARAVE|nr:hypothetical protein AVEN_132380-1 [Araneus ventricosus]
MFAVGRKADGYPPVRSWFSKSERLVWLAVRSRCWAFLRLRDQHNRKHYQDLLEIYVFPQIDYLEAVTGNSIVFMQDGATPHFSQFVLEALNERFPKSWIGRGGPIP